MHPSIIFSLLWFFFTIIPLTFFIYIPINPIAIIYISICTAAFSLPALFFNWKFAFQLNSKKLKCKKMFDNIFLNTSLIISFSLSIAFSILSLMSYGYDLYAIFFDLLKTSGDFAKYRGNGYFPSNSLGSIAILFTYLSSVLGGIIYIGKEGKLQKLIIILLALTPSIFYMLIQSSKLIFFFSIGFFVTSNIIRKIYFQNYSLFKSGTIIKIAYSSVLVVPLLAISVLSREHYNDFDDYGKSLALIFRTLMDYAFAQVFAFADFFSYIIGMHSEVDYLDDTYSYGLYTFTFIFDMLGSTRTIPPGLYQDSYSYNDLISTNIFTIFRGLIYDFGILGSIIYLFLLGIVANFSFYNLLKNKRPWASFSILIIIIEYCCGSYLLSMFMARYMFLLGFVVYLILFFNDSIYYKKYILYPKNDNC
jgi:oligosaccharide repeat unit polymerase